MSNYMELRYELKMYLEGMDDGSMVRRIANIMAMLHCVINEVEEERNERNREDVSSGLPEANEDK